MFWTRLFFEFWKLWLILEAQTRWERCFINDFFWKYWNFLEIKFTFPDDIFFEIGQKLTQTSGGPSIMVKIKKMIQKWCAPFQKGERFFLVYSACPFYQIVCSQTCHQTIPGYVIQGGLVLSLGPLFVWVKFCPGSKVRSILHFLKFSGSKINIFIT